MMECLLPLIYVVTILIAYYGPNAEVLGNIGNDFWHYENIENITSLICTELVMFVVDSLSAVTVAIWLWRSCSINFFPFLTSFTVSSTIVLLLSCTPFININLEVITLIITNDAPASTTNPALAVF